MKLLRQALEEIKEYYRTMCTPAFSEEEKERNTRVRISSEYTRYCKLAAGMGIFSDKQITAHQYKNLLEKGFVWSTDRFGKTCWYNRKTNDTKYLKDLTVTA